MIKVLRRPVESALTAVVRMQHCPGGRLAPPAGHVQGVEDQLGAQVIGYRPAHDPAGPYVQDDGAVQPALDGAVLGDVGDPQLVRAVGAELAADQVRVRGGGRVADRAAAVAAPVDPGQPGRAHQALHPLAAAPQVLAEPAARHAPAATRNCPATPGGSR